MYDKTLVYNKSLEIQISYVEVVELMILGSEEQARELIEVLEKIEDKIIRSYFVSIAMIYFYWTLWLLGFILFCAFADYLVLPDIYTTIFTIVYIIGGILALVYRPNIGKKQSTLYTLYGSREKEKKFVKLYLISWLIGVAVNVLVTSLYPSEYSWSLGILLMLGVGNVGTTIAAAVAYDVRLIRETRISLLFFIAAFIDWLMIIYGEKPYITYYAIGVAATIYLSLGLSFLHRAIR